MIPSLSVVHAVPSMRRNDAPALSSPPKPSEPSSSPSTNHLNPTGTSTRRRPDPVATRSMMLLLTTVLPTAAPAGQSRRCREQVRDRGRQVVIGIHQARAVGVTMPCRSWSGSLANATSKRSRSADQRAPSRTATSSPCGSCRPSRRS